MNDPSTEFVKLYDFTTGQTSMIPAVELAPGMVRIRLEGSDEIIWADSSQLRQGDFQHPPFDGELREKILEIQHSLAEVYPKSYEEWEDDFRRDRNVWQEVDLWLHACTCFNSFLERHSPSPEQRREAFRVIVACLTGSPSTVFETVSLRVLDPGLAKQLADDYFAGNRGD